MTKAGTKLVMLLLTVIVGAALLAPYTDYQDVLDQNDCGRDLYCFKRTMDGEMVYRDYWWIYGPIMPYYYSVFYRMLGVSVRSVLIGQCVLLLLCGVLVFLSAGLFTSPACACIAAVVFWIYYPDFPHTYVYTAGIACILLALYFLLRYLKRPGLPSLLLSIGALVLVSAVKINIGASVLCAVFVSIAGADWLRGGGRGMGNRFRRLLGLGALFGAGVVLVYLPFIWGLSSVVRQQSFPFANERRVFAVSPFPGLRIAAGYIGEMLAFDWCRPLLLALVLICAGRAWCLIARDRSLPAPRKDLLWAMGSLAIVAFFSAHEYLFTRIPIYYMLHWAIPALYLLCVIVVYTGTRGLGPVPRYGVAALVLACAVTSCATTFRAIRASRVPAQYLGYGRGGVYLNPENNPSEWLVTVRGAVDFLMRTVGRDEKIAAFPHDSLYCFLSERDSATRQQEIFYFSHPTEEQERETIASMERWNVRWVVLSNMYRTTEPGKGAGFGLVCCRTLSGYLEERFGIAAVFGPWRADPPNWVGGHGVAILRKREAPGRERLFWWGSAERIQ